MNRSRIASAAIAFFVSLSVWGVAFQPDTTLTAETSNNTSASGAFTARYDEWARDLPDGGTRDTGTIFNNGTLPPGNISKVSIKTMLPNSPATKFWVTSQSWFTTCPANLNAATGKLKDNAQCGSHIDIGYDNDAAQAQKQIDDMISRGFDGLIVNWQSAEESPTTGFIAAALSYAATKGFSIIVEEDMGALSFHCPSPMTPESCVERDINYILANWASSSAYYKINTVPVVMLFTLEAKDPSLNWDTITQHLTSQPLLIWQGDQGFNSTTRPHSSGAYKWLEDPSFYTLAGNNPAKHAWGSAYKGFDDRLASWTKPKVIDQQCGKNWRTTWSQAFAGIENMHVVTWDDYQEGSELETGIDNCLGTVNLSVAGGAANWSLSFTDTVNGTEAGVHHFTLFAAQDGQNLMTLEDGIPVATKTVNLDSFNLPQGTWQIFVKAVGQPSMKNVMSKGQTYVSGGAAPSADITSPASGATVSSPVEFAAQALNDTPTHWALYDGSTSMISFDSNSTAFDRSVALTAGQHTITIQFWDPSGAVFKDAVIVQVAANNAPAAAISVSPTSGVAPVSVSATVTGTDGDGTIASSSIDWGDGSAVTAAATGSHTYSTAGTYVVTGTVVDNGGLSDTATATVTVNSPSTPLSMTLTSPTSGEAVSGMVPVKACAQSSNPISNFTVYFNNGAQKSLPGVSCIDTTINPGCFSNGNVTVNVWDSSGAVTTSTAFVNIQRAVPVASPADGATVSTSVHVLSTACSSVAAVTTSKIYLDGVEVYTTSGAHIDQLVTLTAHKAHWLRMQSWDTTGVAFWGDVNVTVP
jgi:PKD repeat protein